MRIAAICFLLILLPLLAVAQAPSKGSVSLLPIKRVVLYSNGVAFVERRGTVSGNASIDLEFKQSQVDDVLKSMVVLDLGAGNIGAVSYNSSAPPEARMAEIPFSVLPRTASTDGGGGVAGVLAQFQGAEVLLTTKTGAFRGSILNVETTEIVKEKEKAIQNQIVIVSETGEVMGFDLSEVRGVKLLDDKSRKDITDFADASASTRRSDAKTITVTSDGAGQRELVVTYTIAAPIWKTTYRLVVGDDGKPLIQGWAIVDNVSDEDWNNVTLSLVSGSPISFIQDLKRPYYRYRPVVPLPEDIQTVPQNFDEGYGSGSGNGNGVGSGSTADSAVSKLKDRKAIVNGVRETSTVVSLDGVESNTNFRSGALNNNNNQPFEYINELNANTSDIVAEDIGDLFEYKIARPMSVVKNRSALIPIVQTRLEGERVSVYNETIRADRPLSGLRIYNNTALTMETGSVTVIDQNAYAGEALMDRLKPKEQRLISFAVDLGMHVRPRTIQSNEPVMLVKAAKGIIEIQSSRISKKRYDLSNQTEKPKTLYIEYPVKDGWKLSSDVEKPDYVTQKYYRFKVELKPFESRTFDISEERPIRQTFEISDLTRDELELFITRRYIDEKTRQELAKLIDLQEQSSAIARKIKQLADERKEIESDQARLRENITALSKTSEAKQLIERYIRKADEQESRIEQITEEQKRLRAQEAELDQRVENEISAFSFENRP
ncbi:MAG: DUF4200 domain-containing protein [Pyrinomonadaceae bacterium]